MSGYGEVFVGGTNRELIQDEVGTGFTGEAAVGKAREIEVGA